MILKLLEYRSDKYSNKPLLFRGIFLSKIEIYNRNSRELENFSWKLKIVSKDITNKSLERFIWLLRIYFFIERMQSC